MLPHVIIILYSCVTHVTSRIHCQGTCYSGSFPKNSQVIKGKHLRGNCYKIITTDVPQTCFSSCINDCRCKAFQMKGVRCELLDEDKTSKAADFVRGTGYVYYDLQQKFYKRSSHMVQPKGICHNGCCKTHPCLNGGRCVELCQNPNEKFKCKCFAQYGGKVCERKVFYSCLDVLKSKATGNCNTPAMNGNYTITRSDTNTTLPVYCAFDVPKRQAWTLIESFSLENNYLFRTKTFNTDYPINTVVPNWNRYRLSLSNMKYIRSMSSMFRATCDFPNRKSLTPDFLLGYIKDYDLLGGKDTSGVCIRFFHIDIMGTHCSNCTAAVYHKTRVWHFHLDISHNKNCQFRSQLVPFNLDNFGFFFVTDPKSKCTTTQQSTTQWWLGEQQ